MTLTVRRVVTGYDANGKSVVRTDEQITAVPRQGRYSDILGSEIWSTDSMPVDNSSEESYAAQRKGFGTRNNYVGTGQGTLIRVDEFAPGATKLTHRTETIDYVIILSGECDLQLDIDGGEVVHLKPGDVVVNRGVVHTWVNNGPAPCVMAAVLIDAKPVTVAGQVLHTQLIRSE